MGARTCKIRRLFWVGFISSVLFCGMSFISSMNEEKFSPDLEYHTEIPILVEGFGNFEPEYIELYSGPGENGKPYILPPEKNDESIISNENYGMNIVRSDEISLDRTIKDTRLEECKHWSYPLDLPKASVIIVFYNEGLSVLMRTIHSILNRSPENLLHEIILIDDFSDKEDLQENLGDYIQRFNGKVTLLRNSKREGLIRAKSRGANEATGEILIYLDGHCEVNINWLPPLLAPIFKDFKVMAVPLIDAIDSQTFEYLSVYDRNEHVRGIFEWGLLYKEKELPETERQKRKYNSEPYQSPAHAGGIFAINREYFLQLGTYDPKFFIWGVENLDLSFKIWQCGGSIEWVPCSRVGHVYRDFALYPLDNVPDNRADYVMKTNYKRVVEIWFDDKFKEYFYTREPVLKTLYMDDISEQLELKNRLKCKSFQWYIDNVAYDIYEDFPPLPPNSYWGNLELEGSARCLTTNDGDISIPIIFEECIGGAAVSQIFRLNSEGQLAVGEYCVEADQVNRTEILLVDCPLGSVYGPWKYDETTNRLVHGRYKDCITIEREKNLHVELQECDDYSVYQTWIFNKKFA